MSYCTLLINSQLLLLFLCSSFQICRAQLSEISQQKLQSRDVGAQKHFQATAQELSAVPEYRNYSVELMLVHREFERSKEIFDIARRKGYAIKGFYHTSTWKHGWKDVILQQLYLVDGRRRVPKIMTEGDKRTINFVWDDRRWASLLRVSSELFLNVAGEKKEDLEKMRQVVDGANLRYRNKIRLNFNRTIGRGSYNHSPADKKKELDATPGVSEGEYSTIAALHQYCTDVVSKGEKSLVYYFHSKSGSSIRDALPVMPKCECCSNRAQCPCCMPEASWREGMNTFNLEFPSICARAILRHGYSTCGIENQDAHYSGNFWWADCQHVAALNPPHTRFDAWAYEFFVLKVAPHNYHHSREFGFRCGYSMHNCYVNRYDLECPRDWYRDALVRFVSPRNNRDLPVSTKATSPSRLHNVTRVCQELKQKHYSQQEQLLRSTFH